MRTYRTKRDFVTTLVAELRERCDRFSADDDAVPSRLFRLVQPGVRSLEERAAAVALFPRAAAEARRPRQRPFLGLEPQRLDGEPHAFGQAHGARRVGALENDAQLFAAVARHDVTRPC